MRICLIGDVSGNMDEGMKNVAYHYSQELSKNHNVLLLSSKSLSLKGVFGRIADFKPEILHYIPGPSIYSFLLMKFIKARFSASKVVMSAMHPAFYNGRGMFYSPYYAVSSLSKFLIPALKPDLILTQSIDTESMFKAMGCQVEFLPAGVDINRFRPIEASAKEVLRRKYGISKESFVILHVGPIKRGRNIQILKEMQNGENQVVIVGSTYTRVDKILYNELKKTGCILLTSYIPNIEEIYNLADCYTFPTVDRESCIELPLSVMEAMSCNLPVISTKFAALNRCFQEGDGLYFMDSTRDLLPIAKKIKSGRFDVETRSKVIKYSWENIVRRLEEIYRFYGRDK